MNVGRAFAIIIGSGFGFAVAGGALGALLGWLSPNYYRSMFRSGRSPDFDPVQVGLGLGLTQGLIAGIVIGAIVVLVVAIAHTRRSSGKSEG